jgi:uncharacterized phage-associated protein
MTVSAHAVASVLRERLPGVGTKKLHKLLYYCQGHHLATFGKPLFGESISAWDMGPVVGSLWKQEKEREVPGVRVELDQAQLNTVGYVLSRYGALTGRDLENLAHSETPWRRADRDRPPGGRVRIEQEWIEEYFRTSAAEDDDRVVLDRATVTAWLAGAGTRRDRPLRPDSPEEILARLPRRG